MSTVFLRAIVERKVDIPIKLWQVTEIAARREIAHFFGFGININLLNKDYTDSLSMWHFNLREETIKYGINAQYFASVILNILSEYFPREHLGVSCAVVSYTSTSTDESMEIQKHLWTPMLIPQTEKITIVDLFPKVSVD